MKITKNVYEAQIDGEKPPYSCVNVQLQIQLII
jgi:hypothetical protein